MYDLDDRYSQCLMDLDKEIEQHIKCDELVQALEQDVAIVEEKFFRVVRELEELIMELANPVYSESGGVTAAKILKIISSTK